MYSTFERYSSGFGARFGRGFLRKLVKLVVLTLILYLIISSMFLATFQVVSGSMMPFLHPKDRIFVSPLSYGAKFLFFSARLPAVREPARGDVVVIRSPMYNKPNLPLSVLEPFVRFFSFQRGSAVRDVSGRRIPAFMIKRIVAIPGDTIKMSEFKVYIKPEGSTTYTEEQELISRLIRGAPALLAEKGGIVLVAQRRIPLDVVFRSAFKRVGVRSEDGAFRVWEGWEPA